MWQAVSTNWPLSLSCPIMYVIAIIHYKNNKAHVHIVLVCVVAVCVGQNAGRLQAQEQQEQRRSVPLPHRHAEHVSQMPPSHFSYIGRGSEDSRKPLFAYSLVSLQLLVSAIFSHVYHIYHSVPVKCNGSIL